MDQTSNTRTPKTHHLKITADDISIKPISPAVKVPKRSLRYLVMGPTGAGKSSFIEALAGESQNLQISKDQLSGYTQSVTAYQLVNTIRHDRPVYLVDTPGFSDTKISELEIMEMVKQWLRANEIRYFDKILFLTPITETRLGGSKRRTIEHVKSFLKPTNNLGAIAFATTMWDTVHSDGTQHRAESNFAQMRDEILKEFIDDGAKISKFTNTRDSALQILDIDTTYGPIMFGDETSPHSYQDLHERIEAAMQRKKTLELELADPEVRTHMELESILAKNHRDNEETLTKFIGQFSRIVNPPSGFEGAAKRLRKTIATKIMPGDSHYEETFRTWTQEPEIPQEAVGGEESKSVSSESLALSDCPPRPSRLMTLRARTRRLLNVAKGWGT